jgi:hypothetical protein
MPKDVPFKWCETMSSSTGMRFFSVAVSSVAWTKRLIAWKNHSVASAVL